LCRPKLLENASEAIKAAAELALVKVSSYFEDGVPGNAYDAEAKGFLFAKVKLSG